MIKVLDWEAVLAGSFYAFLVNVSSSDIQVVIVVSARVLRLPPPPTHTHTHVYMLVGFVSQYITVCRSVIRRKVTQSFTLVIYPLSTTDLETVIY